ncbi:hypothetical protein GUITHDRAFT_138339 [Guillardia theta CCMP2712]|uniref:B30.2/SPRY domain-containing protein n=1 Tax=Guillardia theta (strain CCMP2712) TaxID=905079 RepID=L1JDN6_GUITC|nr:hypothetical protein GUITHDRAFT_138339 [Guillardia theta CCMP2712]EKX46224.1 hypothetical protein GUITHDRAFT_138339 [Guillardia theta CCMP2712]|eukprot:XP_005833204.1 hypothetical protein GUITHDRAFT_138339 [Guillardia theta CCMP2712]
MKVAVLMAVVLAEIVGGVGTMRGEDGGKRVDMARVDALVAFARGLAGVRARGMQREDGACPCRNRLSCRGLGGEDMAREEEGGDTAGGHARGGDAYLLSSCLRVETCRPARLMRLSGGRAKRPAKQPTQEKVGHSDTDDGENEDEEEEEDEESGSNDNRQDAEDILGQFEDEEDDLEPNAYLLMLVSFIPLSFHRLGTATSAMADPLSPAAANSMLAWATSKKRRQTKQLEPEERLSDMDDDELDEYITKGVGDDDDGKNKKNKRLGAPDVAGIDRIKLMVFSANAYGVGGRNMEFGGQREPSAQRISMDPNAAQQNRAGGIGGSQQEFSLPVYAAPSEASLPGGPTGQLPPYQPAPIPPHMRVTVFNPPPGPGNVVPPEDLEEDLSMEELEEVDGLFFGQWKDAAVCVDRFEVETAGRHLKIEEAGKVLQCRGGEQYHGWSNFVRFSSFARTTRPMTTSGEQTVKINYIEYEVRECCDVEVPRTLTAEKIKGWGSPIFLMIGVTSDDDLDFDYVTFPLNAVVWCQNGKLKWGWDPTAVSMRMPNPESMRSSLTVETVYGDKIGVLLDLQQRKVGFVKNGVLLNELTVYDMPVEQDLRFIASLYDAGSELAIVEPSQALETLNSLRNLDWSKWNSPPPPGAFWDGVMRKIEDNPDDSFSFTESSSSSEDDKRMLRSYMGKDAPPDLATSTEESTEETEDEQDKDKEAEEQVIIGHNLTAAEAPRMSVRGQDDSQLVTSSLSASDIDDELDFAGRLYDSHEQISQASPPSSTEKAVTPPERSSPSESS